MYYNIPRGEFMKAFKKILQITLISLLGLITLLSVIGSIINKSKLDSIKAQDENIVFFGDSITEGYNVKEFYDEYRVVNSGISGNTTNDLINRIDNDLYDYNPSVVIIQIGTNDLRANIKDEEIINNIKTIIKGIRKNRKNASILVESIYPLNRDMDTEYWNGVNTDYNNKHIIKLNKDIKKLCKIEHIKYIDVYTSLLDDNKNLKEVYSKEGLHLTDLGYYKVTKIIKKYLSPKN